MYAEPLTAVAVILASVGIGAIIEYLAHVWHHVKKHRL